MLGSGDKERCCDLTNGYWANVKRVSPAARRAVGWWGWGACSWLLLAGKGRAYGGSLGCACVPH